MAERFANILSSFPWYDKEQDVPIACVVHGTALSVAWKIAENGFSNLSLLDAGYYGRGMYFSSSATYTLPYYATTAEPSLIVCFLIPGAPVSSPRHFSLFSPSLQGNPLPVVEWPDAAVNYKGKSVEKGYQVRRFPFITPTTSTLPPFLRT